MFINNFVIGFPDIIISADSIASRNQLRVADMNGMPMLYPPPSPVEEA